MKHYSSLSFNTQEELESAARQLASIFSAYLQENGTLGKCPLEAIFLQGDLGSGKTTFTRAFVQALPLGDTAEISSPSFTLCNSYATVPTVLHCDLYRCGTLFPDDVWEGLENEQTLCIIEWAEYVPSEVLNAENTQHNYLYIHLKICDEGRLLDVFAHGKLAGMLVQLWQK